MQKVITINLNGNAYQLEETGYDALREYLAEAARALEGNPDRAEIISDLEQAIADKCRHVLGPHKSVVTSAEVEQIIREMGPIDATAGAGGARADAGPAAGASAAPGAKKLFRIPEGAMIGGVCTGLAAYFAVDVIIVRIGFVLAAALTHGAGILAYVAMMFLVPEANTPDQRAAAGTAPFNAQDVVDRAKRGYAEGTRRLRWQWRRQQRQWRRNAPAAPFAAPGVVYAAPPPPAIALALLPVFALANLALFLAMAAVVITLVNTGEVFGRALPEDVPLWAAVLVLLVAYQVLSSPLRAGARWSRAQPGWYAFWNTVIALVGMAFVFWIASTHMPEIREFLERVPDLLRDFMQAVRDLLSRD